MACGMKHRKVNGLNLTDKKGTQIVGMLMNYPDFNCANLKNLNYLRSI